MSEINITSAQYVTSSVTNQNGSITAVIDGIEMSVPIDTTNRHYQAILDWVAEGNTIADAD
tara:strand:+ start:763 stop:945 length:183 start_codon:yes stop_codon:yes gene_type:complete